MKTLLTIIIPLCCFSCSSQDFEGIISNKTTYISKIDGLSATEMFGQEVAYDTTYFKNGFFLNKSSTDFKLEPSYYQQYINSSKFEIMKIIKSPYLRLHIISSK